MINRLLSFLLASVLIFTGCKKESSADIRMIEFGTSFGECLGYCKHYISITSDKITFTKSGASVITKNCDEDISGDDFTQLTEKIVLADFAHLDDRIGCPDCADGGLEWIRIATPESDKEVVYEFGKEPDAVKPFIGILRNYLKQFETCE